jgi:hypothetical protein
MGVHSEIIELKEKALLEVLRDDELAPIEVTLPSRSERDK